MAFNNKHEQLNHFSRPQRNHKSTYARFMYMNLFILANARRAYLVCTLFMITTCTCSVSVWTIHHPLDLSLSWLYSQSLSPVSLRSVRSSSRANFRHSGAAISHFPFLSPGDRRSDASVGFPLRQSDSPDARSFVSRQRERGKTPSCFPIVVANETRSKEKWRTLERTSSALGACADLRVRQTKRNKNVSHQSDSAGKQPPNIGTNNSLRESRGWPASSRVQYQMSV